MSTTTTMTMTTTTHEWWLAALSIGPGIFEIVCIYSEVVESGRENILHAEDDDDG